MEFIIIFFIIKLAIKWGWALTKACIKGALYVISLPFMLLFGCPILQEKSSPRPKQKTYYSDPIEKMEDHWDNHPEDLDFEDIFWLDELAGDD